MYNKIKKHWDNQYSLSTNKMMADFRFAISRGGQKARDFIADEPHLSETALGGHDEVVDVIAAIAADQEAVENQNYFFAQAMKRFPAYRAILMRKFSATVGLLEQLGLNPKDYTFETLLPAVRTADEEPADSKSEPADVETTEPETAEGEDAPAPMHAEPETADEEPADILRATIDRLSAEGLSKSDVWHAVADDAKAIGWTSRQVWAHYDEVTEAK